MDNENQQQLQKPFLSGGGFLMLLGGLLVFIGSNGILSRYLFGASENAYTKMKEGLIILIIGFAIFVLGFLLRKK